MFTITEPSTLNKPWIMSTNTNDEIPTNLVKKLRNYHIPGIEFLYHNHKRHMKGGILNEDPDMDMVLQVTTFLKIIENTWKNGEILIICPEKSIIHWHYHLSQSGHFSAKILNDENAATNHDTAIIILSFNHLKLAANLNKTSTIIIIDQIDCIANKLIIRKLDGKFHIGLTERNFYKNPNPQMFWRILNWTNTGCAGKLKHFPKIYEENLIESRDNYHNWWFRLTWNYCETFKPPTIEEKMKFNGILEEWTGSNDLIPTKIKRKTENKKTVKIEKPVEKIMNEPPQEDSDENDDFFDSLIRNDPPTSNNEINNKLIRLLEETDQLLND